MKLTIERAQAHQGTDRKGRSQGVIFTLKCRLGLDAHEREVVDKYGFWNYSAVHLRLDELRQLEERDSLLTVQRLVEEGFTYATRYASDALHAEDTIKEGCAEFKGVLVMVESYGGNEEFEF